MNDKDQLYISLNVEEKKLLKIECRLKNLIDHMYQKKEGGQRKFARKSKAKASLNIVKEQRKVETSENWGIENMEFEEIVLG